MGATTSELRFPPKAGFQVFPNAQQFISVLAVAQAACLLEERGAGAHGFELKAGGKFMGEALHLTREKHLREAIGRSCKLLLAPNQ